MSSVHTVFGLAVAASCCDSALVRRRGRGRCGGPAAAAEGADRRAAPRLRAAPPGAGAADRRAAVRFRQAARDRRRPAARSPAPAPAGGSVPAATAPAPVAAAPAGGSASAFNPAISLILAGTLREPVARPGDVSACKASCRRGGEVGPGPARIQHRRIRARHQRQPSIRCSPASLTASLTSDNSLERRGGLVRGPGPVRGRRRCAPAASCRRSATSTTTTRTPGTSSTRRCVYQAFFGGPIKTDGLQMRWLAPTDRFFELGARDRLGDELPGSDGGRNGIGSTALFAHVGDDLGSERELAPRRLVPALPRRRSPLRRRQRAPARRSPTASPARAAPGAWTRIYKWAPGGNARSQQPDDPGRVLPAARKRHPELRHAGAGGRDRRAAATLRRRAAGTCRPSTSSCRRWRARRALRPARFRHARGSASSATARSRRPTSRSCSRARPSRSTADARLVALRVQPPAPAARRRPQPLDGDRSADLPSIHHEPGCARRSPVLGDSAMTRCTSGPRCSPPWRSPPCRRRPRSTSSPASPNGRRWRRSSAATSSRSRRRPRPAGSASHRGAAEPDRAHAQRRPARLHRHGARGRLAAGAAAAVGRTQARAAARRATSRPAASSCRSTCRRGSTAARATSTPRGNPHIQLDPRNIAEGRRPRSARALAQIDAGQRADSTRAARGASRSRWSEAIAQVGAAGAAAARHAGGRAAQEHELPLELARRARGRDARAQARRRAERRRT